MTQFLPKSMRRAEPPFQRDAGDVQLQVGIKDDQGRQAYAVNWTLKIGRPV